MEKRQVQIGGVRDTVNGGGSIADGEVPVTNPFTAQAIRDIKGTYGDTVSVTKKRKSLLKFGKNLAASTSSETVWIQGGNETYISTNGIDTMSSSDNGDDQTVTIEGHTISGSNLTFVVQTATLTGHSKVTLSTPLARATRVYNTDDNLFAGDVYIYEDDTLTDGVPNTATKIHLKANGAQSFKASTALSSVDYWIISQFYCGVIEKTASSADFTLEVRQFGGVFRPAFTVSASNTSATQLDLSPNIIVTPNADVRITCVASGTIAVSAWMNGLLAIKV